MRATKQRRARGRHSLSPRECVSSSHRSIFWVHVTFICLLRRPPRCHYFVLLSGLCYGTDFSAPFWLSFTGVILVSGNESKVSSTGCTKNQWLQCSGRLMGSLQKYFYSRLLQTWFLLLLCKNYLFYKYQLELGSGRLTRHEYRHVPNFVPLKAESSVPATH